jgi:hypothetical protein
MRHGDTDMDLLERIDARERRYQRRLRRDRLRGPSPGVAAVLSVLVPGLGQVYNGRLIPGAFWFLATGFGYWAILVPGFLIHAVCVLCAYDGAREWHGWD